MTKKKFHVSSVLFAATTMAIGKGRIRLLLLLLMHETKLSDIGQKPYIYILINAT